MTRAAEEQGQTSPDVSASGGEIKGGRHPATPVALLGGTAMTLLILFAVAVGIAAIAYVMGS